MSKVGDALKAAAKGVTGAFAPSEYMVAGRKVTCPHCGGTRFSEHEALLNTTAATFVHFDWADKSGTALICEGCRRIEWFAAKPERL